ncbi:unnamed protein product [Rotaria sp. Silwood1]|nr:unnamed protein product [Rotaria sp. Silwood1]CAF3403500.1 unnamed protein product [Rotaria sp. Silwood1]
MQVIPIVRPCHILPSSERDTSDSETGSWSSADRIDTPEPPSPEPKLPEKVPQKVQESIVESSIKKKVIIGLSIAAACVVITGIILCIVLPLTLNKDSTITISTTRATSTIITTIHSK